MPACLACLALIIEQLANFITQLCHRIVPFQDCWKEGTLCHVQIPKESSIGSASQLSKANRPFHFLVSPFRSIFGHGPKRLTFIYRSFGQVRVANGSPFAPIVSSSFYPAL